MQKLIAKLTDYPYSHAYLSIALSLGAYFLTGGVVFALLLGFAWNVVREVYQWKVQGKKWDRDGFVYGVVPSILLFILGLAGVF